MVGEEMPGKPKEPARHPLAGLLVSQALGAFNDNAWKQLIVPAGDDRGASADGGGSRAALAQVVLLIPLILFNVPGGCPRRPTQQAHRDPRDEGHGAGR